MRLNGTLLNASTHKVDVQTEFQLDTRENRKCMQSSTVPVSARRNSIKRPSNELIARD